MTKHGRTHIAVLSLALCCVTPSVQAAKPEPDEAERVKVHQVLQSEMATGPNAVNRRSLLQPTQRPETKSDSTWWQSGYVKVDNNWRSVETTAISTADAELLTEYDQQRAASPKTTDGQFTLANWCRSKKLADRERAHLMQVLMLSSPDRDQQGVYERLGYQRVGQQWVQKSELREIAKSNHEMAREFKLWASQLERIIPNLEGTPQQKIRAEADLAKMDDVRAIPLLTNAALANEALAIVLLDHLPRVREYQASQALALLAAFSPSPRVRSTATKELLDRRLDEYVPILLAEMHCPVTVRELGGAERLLIREDANRIVVVDLKSVSRPSKDLSSFDWVYVWSIANPRINGMYPAPFFVSEGGSFRGSGLNTNAVKHAIQRQRKESDFGRATSDQQYKFDSKVSSENDVIDAVNSQVGRVLSAVSGQSESSNPQFWWTWWNIQTGYQELPKEVIVVNKVEEVPVPGLRVVGAVQMSCLVAGTPVWTDRGFVPVEKIATGDCVLAKNIETGELAYKPVVHTTVRQPVPVKKFVVNGQPVVASAGHNFWVSGSGWTKTRELIPQQPIHTVVGMARVESVEDEAEPAPVYNLVVADFHTYFVGPAMILSHDVLPPRPTNVKVPGLAMK
ncbi:MAG: hypothetical protein H7062_01525 [Candidatus Saccharimonas sp.]|nr:hypothetical protein [Planctomycetaceae bacterium]